MGRKRPEQRLGMLPGALCRHRVGRRVRAVAAGDLRDGRRRGDIRTADRAAATPPKLPRCRATLKALQDSSQPLAAVLPVPLALVATDGGDHMSNVLTRVYELIAGGLHDRAAMSITKIQAVAETTMAGKTAAIAGAAAAVAGGGYATVERSMVERRTAEERVVRPVAARSVKDGQKPAKETAQRPAAPDKSGARTRRHAVSNPVRRGEFVQVERRATRKPAPEFGTGQVEQVRAAASRASPPATTRAPVSPASAPEFGPQVSPAGSPEKREEGVEVRALIPRAF